MTIESLARKFKPAGFEQPEGSRQSYTKPRKELQDTFDRWISYANGVIPEYGWWLNTCEYGHAKDLIYNLGDIPSAEVNSLLLDFEPGTKVEKNAAGLFISACHNQSSEKLIVFDVNASDVNHIGYRLGEGKVLINNGHVGDCFGWESSGLILDNGSTGQWAGERADGLVVFLRSAFQTIFINGKIETSEYSAMKIALDAYLDELHGAVEGIGDKEIAKEFVEKYGAGGEKIISEVRKILDMQ